jgi:hypothetical protein
MGAHITRCATRAKATELGVVLRRNCIVSLVKKSNVPIYPGVLGIRVDNVPTGRASQAAELFSMLGKLNATNQNTHPSATHAQKE